MLKFTIGTIEKIQKELSTIENKVMYYDKDKVMLYDKYKDTTVELNCDGTIKGKEIDIKIDLKNELVKIFNNDKEKLINLYKNNLHALDKFIENLGHIKGINSIIVFSTVYIAEDGIPYLNIHCLFKMKHLLYRYYCDENENDDEIIYENACES